MRGNRRKRKRILIRPTKTKMTPETDSAKVGAGEEEPRVVAVVALGVGKRFKRQKKTNIKRKKAKTC